jgi:FkbM family methyltransferase
MDIPIIIICYNNYKYVENTLTQFYTKYIEYYNNIIVLDNLSNCVDTINYLKNINVKVIYNTVNNGPWIACNCNKHIYDIMPDKYIITDPDLEFNTNLPKNFIEILSNISDKYNCNKIGFALDISDFEKMYQSSNYHSHTIYNWEISFWKNKINDSEYELYDTCIDTTFCLINKKNINSNNSIRVAGNFTAKHLPWYINNKVYNVYENYIANRKTHAHISTYSSIIMYNIECKYLIINKNNELFFIEKNNSFNIDFLNTNKNEIFNIFDKVLNKNKIFIDIGGYIGETSMYGSRKSKYVYSIESDNKLFNNMSLNMKNNCNNNYTLINKSIYNIDNSQIEFTKNKIKEESYALDTITLNTIIEINNINPNEISLIKVDIRGNEEHILNDLFIIHKKYNIPLYICFNYNYWNDKNLDGFSFLTQIQKNNIINNGSIYFTPSHI